MCVRWSIKYTISWCDMYLLIRTLENKDTCTIYKISDNLGLGVKYLIRFENILPMHSHMLIYTHAWCMDMHTYARMHVCMHTHIQTHTHIHTHTHTYMRTHTHTHTHTHTCTDRLLNTHTHAHTRTHTHTCTLWMKHYYYNTSTYCNIYYCNTIQCSLRNYWYIAQCSLIIVIQCVLSSSIQSIYCKKDWTYGNLSYTLQFSIVYIFIHSYICY